MLMGIQLCSNGGWTLQRPSTGVTASHVRAATGSCIEGGEVSIAPLPAPDLPCALDLPGATQCARGYGQLHK